MNEPGLQQTSSNCGRYRRLLFASSINLDKLGPELTVNVYMKCPSKSSIDRHFLPEKYANVVIDGHKTTSLYFVRQSWLTHI